MRRDLLVERLGKQAPARFIPRATAYQCVANELRADLLVNEVALDRFEPGLASKFCAPLRQFRHGYVVDVSTDDAGFELDLAGGLIRLRTGGLDLMLKEVGRRKMDRDTRRDVQRRCIELYVAHELRHLTQGIPYFADVQHLKFNAGSVLLGELDLIADVEAAKVLSIIQICREDRLDWHSYIKRLRDHLFIAGDVALKAFGAPLAKPHKVYRALGIAALTARLDAALRARTEVTCATARQITGVIWPVFNKPTSMTLLALTPELKVLAPNVTVDADELSELAEGVDEWPFQDSVARVSSILATAGLL